MLIPTQKGMSARGQCCESTPFWRYQLRNLSPIIRPHQVWNLSQNISKMTPQYHRILCGETSTSCQCRRRRAYQRLPSATTAPFLAMPAGPQSWDPVQFGGSTKQSAKRPQSTIRFYAERVFEWRSGRRKADVCIGLPGNSQAPPKYEQSTIQNSTKFQGEQRTSCQCGRRRACQHLASAATALPSGHAGWKTCPLSQGSAIFAS